MRVGASYSSPVSQTQSADAQVAQNAPAEAAPPQAYAGLSGDVLRGGGGRLTGEDASPFGAPPMLAFVPQFPMAPKKVADAARAAPAANTVAADVAKLAKLSPAKQLEFVAQLRQNNPKQFEALVQAVRSGGVKEAKVMLPVAMELARSTAWAKTTEGKAVMAQLDKMHVQGKIAFGKVPGDNLGIARPDREADGYPGGKGTASAITLNERLKGSPEALAAVLAHEGLHAQQYATAQMPRSSLEAETQANLVGAKVWGSFGADKEKATSAGGKAMVQQLKDDSAFFDPKKSDADNSTAIRTNVATQYAYTWSTAKDKSRFAEGAKMLEDLLSGPDGANVVKSASGDQIKRMFSALSTFIKDPSVPRTAATQAVWKSLFDQMDARKLWDK